MADPISAPPERIDNVTGIGGGAGTGMTWPPTLPFSLALARARALDQSALGMLYRRFMPVVYRYVLARVSAPPVAEDVTSETFLAVVTGIGAMRAEDELSFAAWLLGIARHKVAAHFRRRHAQPDTRELPAEEAHPATVADEGDPLAVITARESWAEVVAALNQLTEEQRAVILYRCLLGYSTEDVARLLERQPNAIRALQFRGLASLARLLKIGDDVAQEQGGTGDAAGR